MRARDDLKRQVEENMSRISDLEVAMSAKVDSVFSLPAFSGGVAEGSYSILYLQTSRSSNTFFISIPTQTFTTLLYKARLNNFGYELLIAKHLVKPLAGLCSFSEHMLLLVA